MVVQGIVLVIVENREDLESLVLTGASLGTF